MVVQSHGQRLRDHDHTIVTGKGAFELSELGRLMPGMAEIMPLVGERMWKCWYAGQASTTSPWPASS